MNYATNFDGDECPLSENGAWRHTNSDWCKVKKTTLPDGRGIAFGTQDRQSLHFDDSYARLTGFPPDQSIEGTIHRDPALDGAGDSYMEVEVLLRVSENEGIVRGYEFFLDWGGTECKLVRWDGPVAGFFTILKAVRVVDIIGRKIMTGDKLKAAITGTTINVYFNGDLIMTYDDTIAPILSGDPGIGFYVVTRGQLGGGDVALPKWGDAENRRYGFTSITARGIPDKA